MDDKLTPKDLIEETQGEQMPEGISSETTAELAHNVTEAQPKAVATVTQDDEDTADMEDLIIPRAKLMQALSPEVGDGAAKAGDIINNLTQEILPETFIPLFHRKHWICFNPRNSKDPNFNPAYEPGALIYRTDNPMDEQLNQIRDLGVSDKQFGPNGERPRATVFHSFMSYFPGVDMPIIVSFCNTSLKAGKQLLSLMQFMPGSTLSKPYTWSYKLTSQSKETDGNKYYVLHVAKGAKVQGQDLEIARQWHDQFAPHKATIAQADVDAV